MRQDAERHPAPVSEFKTVTRHASTVLVGQLAVMAFGVADTVIAGRFSDAALAALSVGSAIYISVYVSLIGIIQALLPIWAEMRGARRYADLGRSLRQSLYLCVLVSATGITALLFPQALLDWAAVPQAMQAEVQHYLAILAVAFVPALLFRLYSTLNQALGMPLLVTWLQVGALFVKVPLSIWFVAGGGGLAPMGLAGCAWATLVVNFLLLTVAFGMLRRRSLYGRYQLWSALEKPDMGQLRTFLRLGLPGGLAYLVEVTSFTLMALFIARLGIVASASHQIAASAAAVLYMVPLSLSIACSARVSFWIGAGHPEQARRMVLLTFRLAMGSALFLAMLLVAANSSLPALYSGNAAVVGAASSLLLWVAAYHVADSLQAVSIFLLRCYRITLAPLVVYGVLLWGIGLSGGYALAYVGTDAYPATHSAGSFWAAAVLALMLVAGCFMALLWRALRRPRPFPPKEPPARAQAETGC
jgi:multidrug resistance protein, MATE family